MSKSKNTAAPTTTPTKESAQRQSTTKTIVVDRPAPSQKASASAQQVDSTSSSSSSSKPKNSPSFLTRLFRLFITYTAITVVAVFAVLTVQFLLYGNHPTTTNFAAQLKDGLNKNIVDFSFKVNLANAVTLTKDVANQGIQLGEWAVNEVFRLADKPTRVHVGKVEQYIDVDTMVKGLSGGRTVRVAFKTQDIPFLALFAMLLLVCVTRMQTVFFAITTSSMGGLNNNYPRAQQKKLAEERGFSARSLASHENSIEAFLFFAVGLLTALSVTGVNAMNPVLMAQVCIIVVAFRIMYNVAYIVNLSTLRSYLWLVSFVATAMLYTVPISHVLIEKVATTVAH